MDLVDQDDQDDLDNESGWHNAVDHTNDSSARPLRRVGRVWVWVGWGGRRSVQIRPLALIPRITRLPPPGSHNISTTLHHGFFGGRNTKDPIGNFFEI